MRRRTFLAAGTVALAAPALGQARPKVVLGVGGKPVLYYLPLTIAERKGFLSGEGLDVEINDFGGGAKALQSLIGGSVDVVTGAYEHTIRMQAKGQDVRAAVELGRFPGISISVRKDRADRIKSVADLKGAKIGVSAPGSSTHLILLHAMAKAGLKPADAAFIGVGAGAGAVAAMKKGELDAISNAEPIMSKLEEDGDVAVPPLVDTRTEAGTRALFGGTNPAAVLYTNQSYIESKPEIMQKLVTGFLKSLAWLAAAKSEDIADAVPPEYLLGDRALYMRAVAASRESYSRNGIVPDEGMRSTFEMLKALDPELANVQLDLARTFTDRFVRAAKV
ncbi:MAG: ABC transporter substrate-binding protein [Beijerinckiaceae bacterium]